MVTNAVQHRFFVYGLTVRSSFDILNENNAEIETRATIEVYPFLAEMFCE